MNLARACLVAVIVFTSSLLGDPVQTKVLLITGGHGFAREQFFEVFQKNAAIEFSHAEHKKDADVYDRPDLLSYDVVVLYDMPKTITDSQKAKFHSLFAKGTGVVVLHHALCGYQQWAEFENLIGGRYPEPSAAKSGVVTDQVGYQHDVQVPVEILAKWHPVTSGLENFTIHDEIYWGFRVATNAQPLITTSHPKSGKPLAWAKHEGKSRLVYLQLGHGPEAFANENYRKLVAQSISFVAKADSTSPWVPLFDGKTLEGWEQKGGKAEYRIEDNMIIGKTVPNTPNSFLCTKKKYADYILELEFKVDDNLNSGVQIRSRALDTPQEFNWHGKKVKATPGRVHGPQVEIDPSTRAWTGGVQGEGGVSWMNDLKNNPAAQKAFKHGDWNKFRIECRGPSIKTWLNDIPAAGVTDDLAETGFIALQVHNTKETKPLEVRFRDIRIKEL